jgi:hypothetical protein
MEVRFKSLIFLTYFMENEFGEIYTEEEIKDITQRILKLSDKFIDELFYRCGFIYEPHKFKALNEENIEEIRSNDGTIEFSLLMETPKEDVLKNLEDIEKDTKNQNQTPS